MEKKITFALLVFVAVLLSGCTQTFMGSVFVFTFRDIIWYVGIAFIFAVLISLISKPEKRRSNFWLWLILGMLLTPLLGFIVLLIKVTRKNR